MPAGLMRQGDETSERVMLTKGWVPLRMRISLNIDQQKSKTKGENDEGTQLFGRNDCDNLIIHRMRRYYVNR